MQLIQRVSRFGTDWIAGALESTFRDRPGVGAAPLRAWVPECGTGEEAYSLAMVLSEALGPADEPASAGAFRLFGTDADPDLLQLARRGVFPAGVVGDVGPARRDRHFVAAPGRGLRVADPLRSAVVFAPHRLGRDPHLTGVDLVLLPRRPRQAPDGALGVLHHALRPGGLLLLGPDHPPPDPALFEPHDGGRALYRSITAASDCPLHPGHRRPPAPPRVREVLDAALARPRGPDETWAVVDREGHLLRVEGRIGRYLDPADRRGGLLDLVGLIHEDLRVELRSLLEQVGRRRAPARFCDLRVALGTRRPVRLELHVEPLGDRPPQANLLLVRFVEPEGLADPLAGCDPGPATEPEEVERLRAELRATRIYLLASRRELETLSVELSQAGEELTLFNEEMIASNEALERRQAELEDDVADLQAERSEQRVLQQELERRADELARDNAHLRAALDGRLAGALVVGRGDLATVLHPVASGGDGLTGEPRACFGALAGGVDYPDLLADLQAVRRSGQPLERLLGAGDRMRAVQLRPTPDDGDAVLVAVGAASPAVPHPDGAGPAGEAVLGALPEALGREVRAVMAGVGGALQVLGGRLGADDPAHGVLGAVEERLGALGRLVHDLELLSGPLEPRLEPVALTELLCQAIAEEAPFGGPHRVALDAPGDLVVAGDGRLLQRLFRNLVRNAVQATPPGGRIAVLAGLEGGGCRVRVIDSGPGIPLALRERVLAPFFTTRRHALGLGLPVARRIAGLHGGELRLLDAEDGPGAAVEVVLPGPRGG